MGFLAALNSISSSFGLGGKRKTDAAGPGEDESPAKKARGPAAQQQQQGMQNGLTSHQHQPEEQPAELEAAAGGQQTDRSAQEHRPAHGGAGEPHQQQHANLPASQQLFGSLPGFNSSSLGLRYEEVRTTLAQPPAAATQQQQRQRQAGRSAQRRPTRKHMPVVTQHPRSQLTLGLSAAGAAAGGRGPVTTPQRGWFNRASLADGSSQQSPLVFRVSPSTGPERPGPRSRQLGSYGSMGPPPHRLQQQVQQQQPQQQRQLGLSYAGRYAADVQRTSRPVHGLGRAGAAAAGACGGRALPGAPAAAAAAQAGPEAAAGGAWRRSASPPLQEVAQRLFGEGIAEEPASTAAAAAGSRVTAAAGGAGPSAAGAGAAAGGVAGFGTSQLTPPARFAAAYHDSTANLGGALEKQAAAAEAKAAAATAKYSKQQKKKQETSKSAEHMIRRIDRTLLANASPDYKPNPAAAGEALQQLQQATLQRNAQRQQDEHARLQELLQQRARASELIAKQHAVEAPRLPALPGWQRRPPPPQQQQQQQQEPEQEEEEEGGDDDDDVVIVSSDEGDEGGSNQEQYPDKAEGSVGSKEGSQYESEESEESEEAAADQEAQAVAELGGLGISAWLAPRSDWSCTQEQLSRYQAVTQGPGPSGEVLASHARSNLDLTRHDLQTLKPNDWLNDECMNMYMALLQDRDAALRGAGGLNCHFFNTFFLNKLYRDAKAYNYKNVRRWTLPARLKTAGLSVDCVLKCDRIIIPVHEGNHWTALMVDVGARRVVFFDSMAGENRRAVAEVKKWVADEAKDKLKVEWDTSSWAEVYPRDIPRQSNGVDCGVFALMFCNRMGLRGGAFDFRQADISVNVRAAITCDLLEGGIQLTGERS